MPNINSQQTTENKLLGLEIMRFISALSVLIWHYQHFAWPGNFIREEQPLYRYLNIFYFKTSDTSNDRLVEISPDGNGGSDSGDISSMMSVVFNGAEPSRTTTFTVFDGSSTVVALSVSIKWLTLPGIPEGTPPNERSSPPLVDIIFATIATTTAITPTTAIEAIATVRLDVCAKPLSETFRLDHPDG